MTDAQIALAAAESSAASADSASTAANGAAESVVAALAHRNAAEVAAGAAVAPTAAQVAALDADAASAVRVQQDARLAAPKWKASTAYTAGDIRQAPDGTAISRNANGTSRASFDATEEAAWTSVLAKAGTLAQRDLSNTIERARMRSHRLSLSQAVARAGIKNVSGNTDYYPFRNAYATWDNGRNNTGAWYALSTQANGINQSVFRSLDGGATWTKMGDIAISAGEYLEHIFVEPYYETILVIKNMNTATNDSYHLLTFNNTLTLTGELDLGANRTWHGGMQNVDAVDKAGNFGTRIIMFAEYTNSNATSARVWKSEDKGVTWAIVKEETTNNGVSGAGSIRHFHCLQVDPWTKDWWLSSGDTDSQCKIWRSQNEGATWTLLWSGDQQSRQLGFVFESDAIYYGMDSPGPTVPSSIFKIDRATMTRTMLYTLPLGLAIYQVTRTFYPQGFLIWTADEFGTLDSMPVYFYDYQSGELTKVFEFYGNGVAMGIQDASRFQDRETGNILVRPGSSLSRTVYGYGAGTSVASEVLIARMV